ncbi:MAG TPA: PIN domain-containing protein [Acidimicrobiales bacterium]|nr:PIN domain-containing protein [Acidimicrobiales bacterium]
MGLTVLDAGVVIGLLDATDAHHDDCRAALCSAEGSGERRALPASALAEVLIGPLRRGVGGTVDRFLDALAVSVVPADEPVAREAAALRAAGNIRLPDALVVATAVAVRADRLLTTDAGWPAVVTDRFAGALHVL